MNIKTLLAASVLFLPLLSGSAVAKSITTQICLQNKTGVPKLILVEDIDNYDWAYTWRPDHNWNGTYVEVNQTRCERAQINYYTNSPSFSFIINGRTSQQKVRMIFEDAIFGETQDWTVLVGTSPSSAILRGSRTYDKIYELGGSCSASVGNICSLFTIEDVP